MQLIMDLNIAVVFLATFAICTIITYVLGLLSKKKLPTGPWAVPLLGSLPFLGDSVPKTFQKWRRKYGDIFKVRLGSMNVIVLNGHDTIKAAAEFPNDGFSSRPKFVSFSILKDENGGADQISFCPFSPRYLEVRKIAATTLRAITNNYRSSSFHEIFIEEADKLCQSILNKSKCGDAISVADEIEFAASSSVYQLFYGSGKHQEERDRRVQETIKIANDFEKFASTGNPFDVMPWLRYFWPSRIAKLKTFIRDQVGLEENEVLDHRKVFDEDFLNDATDYFLKFERDNSHTDLGNVVSKCLFRSLKDMFTAGYSTTSSTLQWLILYMVSFPNIQEEVQKEIDVFIGNGRSIDIKDRENLHFTNATINEILRLTSIVPFGLPHSTTGDVSFMGFDIEKDTPINFNLYSVNHDENTWGDPDTFRPDRFLNAEEKLDESICKKIASFGFGRRKCVGERIAREEVFVMFTTLMQRLTFLKPVGELLDLTPQPGLVYRPSHFRVLVKDRLS